MEIVEQAQRDGVALSEVERKMLQFSETEPTLPNILEINTSFDEECDQDEYEKKIAKLVERADKRLREGPEEEYEKWAKALREMKDRDYYVGVPVMLAGLRPPHDSAKLLGTGLVAAMVLCGLIAGIEMLSKRLNLPDGADKYLFEGILLAAVVAYYGRGMLRLGKKR